MITIPGVDAALDDVEVVSETVAVAQYGGRSIDLNVATDGEFTWDANGELQCSGSIRVFGVGDSLVPKARDAFLAPFGQEVTVSRRVYLRDSTHTIPLGVFRITGNDGGRETYRWEQMSTRVDAPYTFHDDAYPVTDAYPLDDAYPGFTTGGPFTVLSDPVLTSQVLDWEVQVDLADRLRMLQRAKILNPAAPLPGATVYSELQRLTLFPMVQAPDVPDVPVPAGTTYEDRRSAVSLLASMAGAKVRVTRQGALTLRPADRWATATVPEFDLDGVVEFSDAQSDEFYNFVWAHSPDGAFSAFQQLLDDSDPRSVNRAGPSTYEHSSPVYDSDDAVRAGAMTVLSRLLNRRSRTVTVKLNAAGLLLELSDFGRVTDPATGRSVLGEVSGIRISNDPTQLVEVSLIVAEAS